MTLSPIIFALTPVCVHFQELLQEQIKETSNKKVEKHPQFLTISNARNPNRKMSTSSRTQDDMKAEAKAAPFYRLRFDDGYVFRTPAKDEQELAAIAAQHYWWGEEKPALEDIRLTIKTRRSTIYYVCEAAGYPKNINTSDDF